MRKETLGVALFGTLLEHSQDLSEVAEEYDNYEAIVVGEDEEGDDRSDSEDQRSDEEDDKAESPLILLNSQEEVTPEGDSPRGKETSSTDRESRSPGPGLRWTSSDGSRISKDSTSFSSLHFSSPAPMRHSSPSPSRPGYYPPKPPEQHLQPASSQTLDPSSSPNKNRKALPTSIQRNQKRENK